MSETNSEQPTNPYEVSGELQLSFICYADLLGFSSLIKEAHEAGESNEVLKALRAATNEAYQILQNQPNLFGPNILEWKVFSDNVVIGLPIGSDDGEAEIGLAFQVLKTIQASFVSHGFIMRGGICVGEIYIDGNLVFGEGLLDAVQMDVKGGPPIIRLNDEVIGLVGTYIKFYGSADTSPFRIDLLKDSNGNVFLNYLDSAFVAYDEAGVFCKVLEEHKNLLENGLKKYAGCTSILAKYEWLVHYHNFVCRQFGEAKDPYNFVDPDMGYLVADEREKVLELLIVCDAPEVELSQFWVPRD